MAKDNRLLSWLRDAHAMEKSAESILEKQADRFGDYPKVQRKVKEHLEQTRSQAKRLEGCIKRLDGDTSTVKEMVGKFSGAMKAFGAAGADDEIVKGAISDYSFECMEIASYRSLIAAAEAYGEPEIRQTCEEILAEEEEMANWLEDNIPDVTRQYLSKEGVSVQSSGTRRGGEKPRPRA
jgi:ferritin-like metal-binding protein YciE